LISSLQLRTDGQGPNLSEGPAATWDFRRSIKEEESLLFHGPPQRPADWRGLSDRPLTIGVNVCPFYTYPVIGSQRKGHFSTC
jgi:hypothetical protein